MSTPAATITSEELVQKSLQAAISAIEVYNKPAFAYREESFAILMCNAWELLLKAKALKDAGDNITVILATQKSANGGQSVKTNRSGNAMTVGLAALADRLKTAKVDGMTGECVSNIELMIEVRDNAIHFVNADLTIARTVMEIGTAALKNYMTVATTWFAVDFSKYNFFLMPLSFYHGFETAEVISVTPLSQQAQRFLAFMTSATSGSDSGSPHYVTLGIETRIVKGKGSDGLAVKWTSDPNAPAVTLREEDVLQRYPYDSAELATQLKQRYQDIKLDKRYYKIKKPLDSDDKYCKVRYLDPKNPKSGSKKFYGTEVFKVFDLHYTKKDSVSGQPA